MTPRSSEPMPFSAPAAVGEVDAFEPPARREDCPRCLARWPRPGPCDWCAASIGPEPPPAGEAARRCAKIIPEGFHGVTWSNVAGLRTEDGSGPRVKLASGNFARVRAELQAHRRAVLVGRGGAGKSTLASAYAHHAIATGVDRVRWFSAEELLENRPRESSQPGQTVHPVDLAISADVLVLDDLGAELEQAPAGSGLLAQRVGACSRVISARFDRQRQTLITTGFEPDQVLTFYTDRIRRRVFEGAAVVRLG